LEAGSLQLPEARILKPPKIKGAEEHLVIIQFFNKNSAFLGKILRGLNFCLHVLTIAEKGFK